jgi:hypothetical protein
MIKRMSRGRPKKDPQTLKAETLRIPVSAEEKRLINEAAIAKDGEFARWARAILLDAAARFHDAREKRKGRASAK